MNLNTTSNDFVDNIHLVDDTLRKKFRNLEKQLKKQINIKWSIAYLDICIKENIYIYIYIYFIVSYQLLTLSYNIQIILIMLKIIDFVF